MHKAEYLLCLGKHTNSVYRALLAELNQPAPEKGSISLRMNDECIVILIESESLSGLRALSNSFLQLAYASYATLVLLG
jgi:tRNA threonylcarbamoyladenosine modification (KEOPS) complex  Pcc1 subunit